MATYYVSNTASNGYAVGSDSNTTGQAISKSTPWLTIAHAFSAASTGDTIIVNNGTYVESGANPLVQTKQFNLTAQTNGQVIVRASAGAGTILAILSGSSGSVYTGIVFDAQGISYDCVSSNYGTQFAALTFTACQWNNYTQYGLTVNDCQNCTINGAWSSSNASGLSTAAGSTCSALYLEGASYAGNVYNVTGGTITATVGVNVTFQGIQCNTNGQNTGTWNISGTSVIVTQTVATTNLTFGIYFSGTGTGNVCNVSNCLVSVTTAGSAGHSVYGIYLRAITASDNCTGNTVSVSASVSIAQPIYGIWCENATAYTVTGNTVTMALAVTSGNDCEGITIGCIVSPYTVATSCLVAYNTVTSPTAYPVVQNGHGICIGVDADSSPGGVNTLNVAKVLGNTIVGGNHGILCGWQTGVTLASNIVSKTNIGVIVKQSWSCFMLGNVAYGLDDNNNNVGAFQAKADTNSLIAHNLAVLGATNPDKPGLYAGINTNNSNMPSTGTKFWHNIVYATVAATRLAYADSTCTCSYVGNDYYSPVGFSGSVLFSYAGTTYASVTLWAAAVEPTALNADPQVLTVTPPSPAFSGYPAYQFALGSGAATNPLAGARTSPLAGSR